MKKMRAQEEKIKRAIRDIAVIDPLMSVDRLRDALYEKGFKTPNNTPLHWSYVWRLQKKVHKATIESIDRQLVQERIIEFKEKNRLVFDRLVRIAYYSEDMKREGLPPPSYKDQIAALVAIVRLDVMVFKAEIDAGIFEKHIGILESEKRYRPLPPELKEQMMKAFMNWGIIPKEQNATNNIKPTDVAPTAIVVARQ